MEEEKITLYHGTERINVKDIRKKGLLPGAKTGKRSGGEGNQKDIDMVDSREFAESYGDCVVKIRIPKKKVKCSREMDDPDLLFCTAKKIDKKYIKAIKCKPKNK